jgi:hypothetical protein
LHILYRITKYFEDTQIHDGARFLH